jgi:hypothetical protein
MLWQRVAGHKSFLLGGWSYSDFFFTEGVNSGTQKLIFTKSLLIDLVSVDFTDI